jgi:hypothetical protein
VLSGENELVFTADKLSLRAVRAPHNGQSGVSNVIVLSHRELQMLYVTDVAELPQQIYRLLPDICVMEMNHPPAIKAITSRGARLARKEPLNSGTANHLSNRDVYGYLRNRPYLNLNVGTHDRLKLFVAMHLGPANTKLEVLHTLANAFFRNPRRPLLAIRGNDKVYVAWIEGNFNSLGSPGIHIWSFTEPLFGVYSDEVRVWESGPVNGPKAAESFALSFRFENAETPIMRRTPDAAYWLSLQADLSVRLRPSNVSELESELYQELEIIRRKARREQAFSSLVS